MRFPLLVVAPIVAPIVALVVVLSSGTLVRADLVPPTGAVDHAPGRLLISATTKDLPFWKTKPELLRQIREERAVIVSTQHEETPAGLQRFTMVGAGLVHRPKDFCFRASQDYPKLKEISEHFHTVEFDPATRELHLVTVALGYSASLTMRVLPVSEDWRSELQWEVIRGEFKGMTGLIGFEQAPVGATPSTEMSLNARFEAKELPLPRVLMGVALEVVLKTVAQRMRTFLESPLALADTPSVEANRAAAKDLSVDPKTLPGLTSLHLPPGFHLTAFAQDVPNARQMTFSPEGTLYIGSKEEGKVYAIPGAAAAAARGERAPPARVIATGLQMPNGVAVRDGALYIAEISRLLRIDHVEDHLEALAKKPITSALKDAGAPVAIFRDDFPKAEQHGWKYIAFGPDGWLYVPVGAPCNICNEKDPIYDAISRLSPDGKKREIYAHGVRNTVGFDWDPHTKQLWFTDNGRDLLGDDIPSDELNHATKAGQHFGYPFCHQGDLADPEFGKGVDCSESGKYTWPEVKLGPHVASLGMKFYAGAMFPETYKHRVFIAEHGSWNRSHKIGYRVVSVPIDAKGKAGVPENFIEGWLKDETSWGRSVDVVVVPDGSLLVSDDQAGLIYRVTYAK